MVLDYVCGFVNAVMTITVSLCYDVRSINNIRHRFVCSPVVKLLTSVFIANAFVTNSDPFLLGGCWSERGVLDIMESR